MFPEKASGSTRAEADREHTRWRNGGLPLLAISRRRFTPLCPTLRTQPGASSTNSSRIFFCCRRRDETSTDGFSKEWLRCPTDTKHEAPGERTHQGPDAPLAHRRLGYWPMSWYAVASRSRLAATTLTAKRSSPAPAQLTLWLMRPGPARTTCSQLLPRPRSRDFAKLIESRVDRATLRLREVPKILHFSFR